MAKKIVTSKESKVSPVRDQVASVTPVRRTPAPKKTVIKAPAPITYERIAERAYYISMSAACGSEFDNWCRAERELKSAASGV